MTEEEQVEVAEQPKSKPEYRKKNMANARKVRLERIAQRKELQKAAYEVQDDDDDDSSDSSESDDKEMKRTVKKVSKMLDKEQSKKSKTKGSGDKAVMNEINGLKELVVGLAHAVKKNTKKVKRVQKRQPNKTTIVPFITQAPATQNQRAPSSSEHLDHLMELHRMNVLR